MTNRLRLLLLTVIGLLPMLCSAAEWMVEAEKDGYVTWSKDSVADIHAPGGLTLWNTHRMSGNVVIEYEARIVSDGRVSDLNCFWMASEPFKEMKKRGGAFLQSYALKLYYVGYGGNHNKTTRFRRYDGDRRGIDSSEYRPAILREYRDESHTIRGDHWYKIRLEAIDGHARYYIDGECLVDYVDPEPLKEGWFGFRTTLSHAQLRNFRWHSSLPDKDGITLNAIGGKTRTHAKTPVTIGVPFDKGELKNDDAVVLKADGTGIATDAWTIATWPDGSVKWKAVAAVVPENTSLLKLERQLPQKKASKEKGKTGSEAARPELWMSGNGNVCDSITLNGTKVAGALWVERNGTRLTARTCTKENEGKVRTCWKVEGDDFTMRLYTYRGSNEIKVVHTAFIDSTTNAEGLKSLAIKANVPMRDDLHKRSVSFATNDGKHISMDVKPLIARRPITLTEDGSPADEKSAGILRQIAAWDGFRLSQLSPNAFSIRKRATDRSPWIGTIEGLRAPGLMTIGDTRTSMAFHLDDFWQSYPSTLQVDGARSNEATVTMYLWSPEAESMSFEHYDTIPHGLDAAYEDIQPDMSTAASIARTSTLFLYPTLSAVGEAADITADLLLHTQYTPTPEYLHRKRAFGYWSLDKGTPTDTLLYNIIEFYAHQQEEHGWYGFFNYGDVMHSYDASRGEWRYDVGGYAWDNTELGTPAMLWYEFLRTGDAKAWRMATAMTRHNAEVDSYHRGPHAGLGTRHNVLHWGCGAKEARISQAFWNRFLYYITGGDERTGDIMREVVDADQLLYKLDPMRLAQPRSERYPCTAPARLRVGPDWLAYAGNWFTEWERTGNTQYRDKIITGMKSIAAMPHGLFSGPKALGYDPATGVITWEGDTTQQNTNHLLSIMGGFEMMNEMMLSVNTTEWDKAWLAHAANYKEKALEISRNHFRIPRLKAYAYWKTGNRDYRKAADEDLARNNPFKMLKGAESLNTIPMGKGGFFTNDAATFMLDAIFMQEVTK